MELLEGKCREFQNKLGRSDIHQIGVSNSLQAPCQIQTTCLLSRQIHGVSSGFGRVRGGGHGCGPSSSGERGSGGGARAYRPSRRVNSSRSIRCRPQLAPRPPVHCQQPCPMGPHSPGCCARLLPHQLCLQIPGPPTGALLAGWSASLGLSQPVGLMFDIPALNSKVVKSLKQ